jgi:hypothetical protein
MIKSAPINWYSHIPNAVCEHEDVKVPWELRGTNRKAVTSRTGITIKNKTDKICLFDRIGM